jgi:hypothetical protein
MMDISEQEKQNWISQKRTFYEDVETNYHLTQDFRPGKNHTFLKLFEEQSPRPAKKQIITKEVLWCIAAYKNAVNWTQYENRSLIKHPKNHLCELIFNAESETE